MLNNCGKFHRYLPGAGETYYLSITLNLLIMNSRLLFCGLLFTFWSVVLLCITLAAVPLNPISLSFDSKMNILSVVPEGWGFFTRNPREPSVHAYKRNENRLTLVNKPMSDPDYWFGLSRKSRKINMELMGKIRSIPDSVWQQGRPDVMDTSCDSVYKMSRRNLKPLLLGEYLVIRQNRLPWAWAGGRQMPLMPYQKVLLIIN